MRVDAHHHLWHYNAAELPWIDDTSSLLRRDFLVPDLLAAMSAAHVDAAIAVQARSSLVETDWLLDQAAACPAICGVVGWVPLCNAELPALLERFDGDAKLLGFREITQAEPAGYLDQPAIDRGLAHLTSRNLCYDLLLRADQLAEATRLVDRHPRQRFVLDHAAKPPIAAGALEPWRTALHALAQRENVVCKLSGLVTEADWHGWTPASLQPFLDACVESFGPHRLLAASDWPVCLLASTYSLWWATLDAYFASFTASEQRAIFGDNALRVYRCPSASSTTSSAARPAANLSPAFPAAQVKP